MSHATVEMPSCVAPSFSSRSGSLSFSPSTRPGKRRKHICTAIPRRLWSPRCCRTKARSAFVSVYLRINSPSSSGKASNCIRSDEVRISRRGINLECTENDHFHERNTHLKWLFVVPRASFSHALNVRNIPFLEVSRSSRSITVLQGSHGAILRR